MYAIVEINGQQFKVEEGKKLFVNHIKDAEEGKTVEFDKVLLLDNNGTVTVGAPTIIGVLFFGCVSIFREYRNLALIVLSSVEINDSVCKSI